MGKEGSSLLGLLGVAVILVSYFLYPESYHQFFQWLQEGFFQALNDSFDGPKEGGRGQKK